MICIGASFVILLAALLTGSRGGAALTAFMIIWSIYSIRKRGKAARALAILLAIMMLIVFISSYIDLSRIFSRFNDSSTSARVEALNTALEVAISQPILGTGIGKYYHRIYSSRFISILGKSTIIDPHNAYILLLSEIGLIFFAIYAFLFVLCIRPILNIKDFRWRLAGKQLLFVILIYSLIGSQVINEISISIIAWLYIGYFIRYASIEKRIDTTRNRHYSGG
jgi:O-antigen ligase